MNPRYAFAVLACATAGLLATSASAETWSQAHPRRAEVNARLAHENARISAGRADGQLSRGQAHQLRREDHIVRREERLDARLDHGHITRADQRALNQQENRISRQIHQDRH